MEKAILLILVTAISGGSVPIFAKYSLEVFQPFTLIFLRFLVAVIALLPFIHREKQFNIDAFKGLFKVALIGSLNPILLFIALQFTLASASPLIYAAVPTMTAAYLHYVNKQKIHTSQLIGIIVGFLGVAMVILLPLIEKGQTDFQALQGNILIFGAAIAFMFYGLLSKKKQTQLHITPVALTFYFSLVTLIFSIPFMLFELTTKGVIISDINYIHVLSAIAMGVLGTAVFVVSYQYALKLSSELTAALFTYIQPVSTIILASIFLGERITVPFVVGGVLAVVGAQIASKKSS